MDIFFIKQVLEFLGIKIDYPIKFHCDNVGAILFSYNAKNSQRKKHVDVRAHYVRKYVEDGMVNIVFVKSEDNAEDIYTKNVSGTIFKKHATRSLYSTTEQK